MPIREYQCSACGVLFEKLMKQDEEYVGETCQVCGEDAVEEIISASELRFKGEGTYKKSKD